MSGKKRKIRKLTDEQYNAYIATLKDEPALYSANGKTVVPPEIDMRKDDKKQGD